MKDRSTALIKVQGTATGTTTVFLDNIQDIKIIKNRYLKYNIVLTLVSGKGYITVDRNNMFEYATTSEATVALQELLTYLLAPENLI